MKLAVEPADIDRAVTRLHGATVRTPLIENLELNARAGGRVFLKLENLQHGGSFKYRGAFNRLSQLSPDERSRGVVAWSSGNHAQGVALAARILGMPATIVMPSDAPAIKLANTIAYGAEVVPYDRQLESRELIATELARSRGAVLVPSYDDPHIIAGQGTAGVEIVEQVDQLGGRPDQILVCCGGGGLVAGIALAVHARLPNTAMFSVEPDAFDDTARSLAAGERVAVPPGAQSICDALLAPTPGELTFPINRAHLAGGLSVSDDEVREAIRFAASTLKLVVEPGGAVALAAILAGKAATAGRTTVAVVSGGNIDARALAALLA